jgi:superfamily II DNA or RNA helicase
MRYIVLPHDHVRGPWFERTFMSEKKQKGGLAAAPSKKEGTILPCEVSSGDLGCMEFHRDALALVPDPSDKRPGVAFFLPGTKDRRELRTCSCSVSRSRTCAHILKLVEIHKTVQKETGGRGLYEVFRSGIWYRFAAILGADSSETRETVRLQFTGKDRKRALRAVASNGKEMLRYLSRGADATRFHERFGRVPETHAVPHRAAILEQLRNLALNDGERVMLERGFRSHRLALEESFWYGVAYHGFREFGEDGVTFHPAIEESTGAFTVTCRLIEGDPVFRMVIPRGSVRGLLTALNESLPNQHGLTIHPIPLKSLFRLTATTALDLEVRPIIQVLQESGESRFFEREDLERFRYGDLLYVRELGILAELEPPGPIARKFAAPVRMVLKKSQVPFFLQEFEEELREGGHMVEASVKALRIIRQFDSVEIAPDALDRDWCWLSVQYGSGNASVSLAEIFRAKKEGQRYVPTDQGWVDCQSPDFEGFEAILDRMRGEEPEETSHRMRLSRLDLLRLNATVLRPLRVAGDGEPATRVRRMLELKPARPLGPLTGLVSPLRKYQSLGVEWLMFLYENGLGGLLCDDMGLGKTHQVMALMVALREHEGGGEPFLVVCPTTVLSHWQRKILEHAPGLKAEVFHGGQRDLDRALCQADVLLTSYGILRNDIEQLKSVSFALAVFDEIQNIKNPQTLAYEAARELAAGRKLGLTGTPIENHVGELKALFDVTVPGYLGSDGAFAERFLRPIDEDRSGKAWADLSRLISPFTLRRLKRTVLDDLPEKIEDLRTCTLSNDQLKFYRDAIASRGIGLRAILEKREQAVPYIHIFALLTLLKQICDHPALLEGGEEDPDRFQSGKWDLFKEILQESLDSGQKVVVYSQFLGMIRMIEGLLRGWDVGFVSMTGGSRNRGAIVSRFNEDPDCRIYVGSLKAGGTGIDLVAASVVIHYDRWWNAAREDQATDRVHRIGQRRGVQVFKLVTEGTLEEKISAIIEKKRKLMESIVVEDDPGLLKTFSREELMEMLSPPP